MLPRRFYILLTQNRETGTRKSGAWFVCQNMAVVGYEVWRGFKLMWFCGGFCIRHKQRGGENVIIKIAFYENVRLM